MTKSEKNVKELLEEIKEAVAKPEKKEKPFKLPFFSRVGKSGLKKNWATFVVIGENKEVSFVKKRIDEGVIEINESPYVAMADYAMTHKGKPIYIIPSWDIMPYCPRKEINDAEEKNKLNLGYKLLLNKMRKEAIAPKKAGGWLVWILIAAAAIGVFYLLSSGNFKIL